MSQSLEESLGLIELPEESKSQIPEETCQEIAASTIEISESAKNSLDFLAGLALPLVYTYAFPPLFHSLWEWLTTYSHKIRDFSQLALGLPRGFGKTMVIKLFILYAILFTKKKFILVLCETTQKAKNIIADVADMLDEPNIVSVFGNWRLALETDTQELKKFGFRSRNIILMGAGVESGIRGITIKNARPDVMIFDDIQSRACADSQVQSETLEREMYGTAMKAKSPHGCQFIFIANMYPTKWSLLRRIQENPNWIKFIVGGILEDGTSLWEDLQPIEQLKREFRNDLLAGHPEIFYAEVLNDPNASASTLIDLSNLPTNPNLPGDIPGGNFILIDPSTDKTKADEHAIGYFEVHVGYPVLMELIHERLSPGECIRKTLSMALRHNCRAIVAEGVAYQYSLLYWFNFISLQLGITGFEFLPIYPGGSSKNARILQMLKSYAKGEIYVDDSCKPDVHYEISQFNPLKTNNTDNILDLLCYAPRVIAEFGEYIIASNIIEEQEIGKVTVWPESLNSPF